MDPINSKVHVYPEKLTHFYMWKEAEIWQTYRFTTQTKGKIRNMEKMCPGLSEMGDGMCHV